MSRCHVFMSAGLVFATLGLTGVPSANAASGPLQRTNAGSGLYMVTPAMMHAIDVIVAEKMKMARHRH